MPRTVAQWSPCLAPAGSLRGSWTAPMPGALQAGQSPPWERRHRVTRGYAWHRVTRSRIRMRVTRGCAKLRAALMVACGRRNSSPSIATLVAASGLPGCQGKMLQVCVAALGTEHSGLRWRNGQRCGCASGSHRGCPAALEAPEDASRCPRLLLSSPQQARDFYAEYKIKRQNN